MAKRAGKPVYALAAAVNGTTPPTPYRAPCYDTSLYFDDLHLDSDDEAAALIAAEAREGYERGHRAFKIKVGRGARHMPLEAGTRRDIAVVKAVRDAVGPGLRIMLDANDGYNLNLTKHVLTETADCDIFWMEEPFHEDPVLYRDLRAWLQARGPAGPDRGRRGRGIPPCAGMGARGHHGCRPVRHLRATASRAGSRPASNWTTGARAPRRTTTAATSATTSPPHLAGAIRGFTFVEWDQVTTPGIDAPGYVVRDGWVEVPDTPGFGITLDEATFRRAVEANGYDLSE